MALGVILGYFARQSIARNTAASLEGKLEKLSAQAQKEAQAIIEQAKSKAQAFRLEAETEEEKRRKSLLETEQLLLKRENVLDKKLSDFESKEKDVEKQSVNLSAKEKSLEELQTQTITKLEHTAGLTREQAKQEMLEVIERQEEKNILGRMRKLEQEGQERFQKRAKEMVAYAVQKIAVSQSQEITTTTIILPSEDLKGKIIGKEGRNIRSLERAAGVEIIVDEAPETVVISGFDPVRRHVAKIALENLIKDGRIHPTRVEEEVTKAQEDIDRQIKEAGETVVYDLGIVGLDPKLVQILGRLKFRTSYGQNVLLHSIEVAYLASSLAAEIGVNVAVAKKAGLFHDIGKALDHQVEGSHVEIGIRILEKFNTEKEVIDEM